MALIHLLTPFLTAKLPAQASSLPVQNIKSQNISHHVSCRRTTICWFCSLPVCFIPMDVRFLQKWPLTTPLGTSSNTKRFHEFVRFNFLITLI
ncbi:hypothetical protein TNIN_222411 [Trichonephila inaurata madagascariensis]|uniref:Secreted protein n=1 Tax=Trichonephila inaurata madagascariensis TaxID=2747483 RepID=A0A8X7C2T2_9ARAC|nr:hypothetical protein TNIN_222411 [Trichonephila inaurata madagascariensis]